MTTNPLIALGVRQPDISGALEQRGERKRQEEQDAKNDEVRQVQLANAKLESLSQRQRQRLESSILGAAELGTYLESDNIEGARDFLTRRRSELGKMISEGANVDTAETDDALRLLDENPEELRSITQNAVKFGQLTGVLKSGAGTAGGNTGVLIDRLINEPDNGIDTVADALGAIKGGAGAESRLKAETEFGEDASKAKKTGELKAKLELDPQVAAAVEVAKAVAKDKGEASAKLNSMVAQYPRLQEVTQKLSELGKTATFTLAGRGSDTLKRELGLPVGEGATARAEYIATIDNEILPLLRQTFGSQFTEREGESLKNTLGDPNRSPEEKDAVLRAFIAQKAAEIQSLARQTGQSAPDVPQSEQDDFEGFEILEVN